MSSLRSWESVKDRVHDISGIEKPENWLYESKDGIFYPVEDLGEDVVTDEQRMFDELDPDWTDEEMIAHGWTIKYSKLIGDDDVVDYRDGCGHKVMETVEPKEVKRIGFM